ncbi:MAG: RNA-dependent DNA polymerase [Armatimonadetes bacterium]|nr:RNA-dependent DNA polymerase [Armatimonadota bacterium]
MKRAKNLYPHVWDFANLLLAAHKALRGKRRKSTPARFSLDLEKELCALEDELRGKTYTPGPYHEFEVLDPKRRLVSAAPFRDRVVHHALCNVIEPLFEPSFIFDSYACRKGKGTHAAADRATRFARASKYVLQCDVSDYFASIDHEILLGLLGRKIGCADTLWLIERIIGSGGGRVSAPVYYPGDSLFAPYERRRGLPLGNQTSQFFANVYLNRVDHIAKEELGLRRYIRYVDDMVMFGDEKEELWGALAGLEAGLSGLRLHLNPRKTRLQPVELGFSFMGYRIFPDHRRLKKENGFRFRRRLHRMAEEYRIGERAMEEINPSVQSWIGHASHADTWGLRRRIFGEVAFASPRA